MADAGGSLHGRSLGYFGTGGSLEPQQHGGSLPTAGGGTGNSLGVPQHSGSSLPSGLGFAKSPLRPGSRNSPYDPTPVCRTPGGSILGDTEHGEFLAEKLEYIVPPAINAVEREVAPTGFAVFMGHMKFEPTAAEVRWIIRKLTGVTAVKAEPRSKGCFLVQVANEHDERIVRTLHRRLLMDRTGFWYARDANEQQDLSDYIEHVVNPGPKKRLRLPKDCVTVETPHSTPVPPSALQQPQQQQPQQHSGSPVGQQHQQGNMNLSGPNTPLGGHGGFSRGSPTASGPPAQHHHHHHQHQFHGGSPSAPPPYGPPVTHQHQHGHQHHQPSVFGRGRPAGFNDAPPNAPAYGHVKSPVGYGPGGSSAPPPYPGGH